MVEQTSARNLSPGGGGEGGMNVMPMTKGRSSRTSKLVGWPNRLLNWLWLSFDSFIYQYLYTCFPWNVLLNRPKPLEKQDKTSWKVWVLIGYMITCITWFQSMQSCRTLFLFNPPLLLRFVLIQCFVLLMTSKNNSSKDPLHTRHLWILAHFPDRNSTNSGKFRI